MESDGFNMDDTLCHHMNNIKSKSDKFILLTTKEESVNLNKTVLIDQISWIIMSFIFSNLNGKHSSDTWKC